MDNKDLVIALLRKRNQRKGMLTLDEKIEIRDKIIAASLSDKDWEMVEKVVYGEER